MCRIMTYQNNIAAHEAGHCVALAAAGLAGEFVLFTITPQMDEAGRNVDGQTKISKETLNAYSGTLHAYSETLRQLAKRMAIDPQNPAVDPQGPRNLHDFLVEQAPRVCLPYICFFFGGGACDRWLKREDRARNAIDHNEIFTHLFPAMTLNNIGDAEMSAVQGKVDEFLFNVFEREGNLLDGLYGALVQKGTVLRKDLGPLFNEMEVCGERAREDYASLLNWFSSWYEPQVQTFEG